MKKTLKKHLKGVFLAILGLITGILCIILGIKMFKFFLPFIIGWILAMIASPLVEFLEKKLKISRKHTSMVIIIMVLGAIIGGSYLIGAKVMTETGKFLEQAPNLYSGFSEEFQEVEHNLRSIIKELPDNVQASIDNTQEELGKEIGTIISTVSEFTVDYAGNIAKNLPNALISTIFTLLSSYFFIADRNRILEFGRKHTPKMIQDKWRMLAESFKKVFSGYFKAQFKIMGVIWLILFIGMLILRVKFAILISFLVSFLDMLPFFGTGTALIPWAILKALSGDTSFAVGLVILYLVTQLVRRIIEPKMVGDSIGMNPLVTLIFMYTGYKISSVLGMILAVPIGAIVINFYKAGVFDGMLKNIRNLFRDFVRWARTTEE